MSDIIAQSPRDLQTRASLLVDREVYCCMSSMVSALAAGYGDLMQDHTGANRPLRDLIDQAMEFAAPVLDYESAAREAGYEINDFADSDQAYWFKGEDHDEESEPVESITAAWRDCCETNGIKPHELEVYEHWAVSSWLADKLEAKGERVDRDFADLSIWARTTTGQAIYMDNVIQEIVSETGYASGV